MKTFGAWQEFVRKNLSDDQRTNDIPVGFVITANGNILVKFSVSVSAYIFPTTEMALAFVENFMEDFEKSK